MYTNFAAQFAPEVALPPYGEWATPEEPEAGLSAPENLYDSQGTPLNYIQNQGGPRTFLVPRGQPAMAPVPGNPALQEQVPLRYLGLRMSTDPNTGVSANPQPQDLMRNQPSAAGLTPDTVVPNWGREVVVPLPQQEQPTQLPPPTQRQNHPGPRQLVRLPGQGDPYNSGVRPTDVMEGAQNRRMYETMDGVQQERVRRNGVDAIQGEFNAGTVGGLGTLQRLIEESGFGDQLSNFISRFQGRAPEGPGRRSAPGAEMESELRGMSNPHSELSMVDQPPENAVPTVTPTSSVRWNGAVTHVGPDQQASRAEEVAAMLRANGIRVTSVTRNNNASPGGHDQGNSIDVDPSDRIRARNLIIQYFPGLYQESFHFDGGTQHGGGVVSTGTHGHFDLGPAAAPRRARRTQR